MGKFTSLRSFNKRMKKLSTLFFGIIFSPFAFAFVITARLISPIIVIRWHAIISSRIGHFAENMNIYLSEKKSGLHKLKGKIILDLFYLSPAVSNDQLAKMWKREIIILPYYFMHVVSFINEKLINKLYRTAIHDIGYYRNETDLKKHKKIELTDLAHAINLDLVGPPLSPVDKFNSQDKSDLNISFTKKEIDKGEKMLEKYGIDPQKKIVGIILRDNEYLKKKYPNNDWSYHQIRNSHYKHYEDCAKKLLDLGYVVIVFGVSVNDANFVNNKTYINYSASKLKSDFMDIYLCSKLHFAISSGNGLDAIPIIFKKPIVEIAVAPIDLIRTYSSRIKILFKTYFSKTLQRKLTLKEIYNFGLQNLQGNDLTDEIEFIHPTPEEITSAALELHYELKNKSKYLDEEKILINNFKNLQKDLVKNTFKSVEEFSSSIGILFLKNNKYLLDK